MVIIPAGAVCGMLSVLDDDDEPDWDCDGAFDGGGWVVCAGGLAAISWI